MEEKREYRCPVEEGEIVEAKCEGQGEKGDGIFKVAGFVIIVPGTEIDSTYKIKITHIRQKLAFGKIYTSEE